MAAAEFNEGIDLAGNKVLNAEEFTTTTKLDNRDGTTLSRGQIDRRDDWTRSETG